jgi:hypothetical protein
LDVHFLISYLTTHGGWRQGDFDTYKMVRALKGKPINGYFEITVSGKPVKISEANKEYFFHLLTVKLAQNLDNLVQGNFTIVPIPNKSALVSSREDFPTLGLARKISEHIGSRSSVSPALRWNTELTSAHAGGSRDPKILYRALQIVERPTGQIVLLDDVMTMGSHARACVWKLDDVGIEPKFGLVAGRTTVEKLDSMFGWRSETLEVARSPYIPASPREAEWF